MKIVSFILVLFLFSTAQNVIGQSYALRFYGHGVNAIDSDRVKIRIDEPANNNSGPPADIGATDFTIEFWVKGDVANNTADAINCGFNIDWIYGNIVVDRDRYNQDRKYGISFGAGIPVFGVSGDGTGAYTLCGMTNVLDNQWHHLAFQRRRSDGQMWVFVDGVQEGTFEGPDGDVSYPDDGVPTNNCLPSGSDPCVNSDPFIVLAAEKHDAGAEYPSFNGYLDELRLSNVLRYSSNFTPPTVPFTTDLQTAALYHFDEGTGNILTDVSEATGGPSHGEIKYGGNPMGPIWSMDTPFAALSVAELFLEAKVENQTVGLNWSVSNSAPNPSFEIKKSKDGQLWECIPFSSNHQTSDLFSYQDSSPFWGRSYYQVQYYHSNKVVLSSDIISVDVKPLIPELPALIFDGHLSIPDFLIPSNFSVLLFNVSGQIRAADQTQNGNWEWTNLPTGLWFLVMKKEDWILTHKVLSVSR